MKQVETIKHLKRKGLLEVFSGLVGLDALQDAHDEQMANRKAESRAVRQKMWGSDVSEETDEMRQTILGDIHNTITNPEKQPSQLSKLLGPLLIASGLGGGLYGAGVMVADALENRPIEQVIEDTDTDTTTVIELE